MNTTVLTGFVVTAIAVALLVAGIHAALSGLDSIVVVGTR